MRSFVFIVIFSVAFLAQESWASTNMCINYLNSATSKEQKKRISDKENQKDKAKFLNANNLDFKEVITKSEKIIDVALAASLLKPKLAEHLKSDLKELKSEKNPKENFESFQLILKEWESFISETLNQIENYKSLSTQEKKKWKDKMELPVYFASGHFISFLETRNKNFNYARMLSILKNINSSNHKKNMQVFLYLFEKQVLRFFSPKEFKKCKA